MHINNDKETKFDHKVLSRICEPVVEMQKLKNTEETTEFSERYIFCSNLRVYAKPTKQQKYQTKCIYGVYKILVC